MQKVYSTSETYILYYVILYSIELVTQEVDLDSTRPIVL